MVKVRHDKGVITSALKLISQCATIYSLVVERNSRLERDMPCAHYKSLQGTKKATMLHYKNVAININNKCVAQLTVRRSQNTAHPGQQSVPSLRHTSRR